MILPTIAIHHPLDHDVVMNINAVDYREGEHEMWVDPVPDTTEGLRIQKGARGLWFVKRGGEAMTAGFKTEGEAEVAMAALQV